MKCYSLLLLSCLLIPLAGYGANASALTPAPVVSGTAPHVAPLTGGETRVLEQQQAVSSLLLNEQGAGCRQVWNNDTQQNETICMDPMKDGILFGLYGGILGALFGGPAGMVLGATVGGVGAYAITDSEYGD